MLTNFFYFYVKSLLTHSLTHAVGHKNINIRDWFVLVWFGLNTRTRFSYSFKVYNSANTANTAQNEVLEELEL